MMVGRDLSSFYKKEHDAHGSRGPVIFSVRTMGDGERVRNCSFDLHEGEVLGLAGLVGAGRTELARLIYGADPKAAGEVLLDGRPLEARTPKDALDAGLAYLTEDRKGLGLFLDMSCGENINVGVIDRDAGKGCGRTARSDDGRPPALAELADSLCKAVHSLCKFCALSRGDPLYSCSVSLYAQIIKH